MKQTRNLEDLLRQYDLLAAPAARDAAVTGICNDSRRARDGDLFICKGYGFKPEYLAMARRQGAVCALAETDFPGVDIPCIRVTDVRKAQSLAARWFYDNPSDSLTLIGVTGTKGKTTTSYMIQAVTNALAGRTMGLSSSAGRYCGGPDVDTHLTTPESLDLQWLFAQARDHGLPYMTAEVSSQAYQVERVYGEHFDIGVFLNFSEDHISPKEHASMEEYLQCKLQLLENSGRAVICRETAQFDRVYDTARRCCREVMLVGMDRDDCDLTVRQVEKLTHGFRFFVQERGSEALHPYHLAMDGDFNIENALAAIGVGRMLGAEHEQMAAALDALEVPGRMNRYEGGGVHVLVDCMHNRASSQALLTDLKRDYPGAPITVDDNALCILRMSGGAVGTLAASWTVYGHECQSTCLYGTKGIMLIYNNNNPAAPIEVRNLDGTSTTYNIPPETNSGVIDEFVDALEQNREPEVSGKEALSTMRAIFGSIKSSEIGRTVSVNTSFVNHL